jgi:hypothetical protein
MDMCGIRKLTILLGSIAAFCGLPMNVFGQSPWESYRVESTPSMSNHASLDSALPERLAPVWGFDVGGIWLRRSRPDSQVLAVDQTVNVLSDADQLQGSMGKGLDLTVNFFNVPSQTPLDFQMRFFQASDMNAEQSLTAGAVRPIFFQGTLVDPGPSQGLFHISQVRSFEANMIYRTPMRVRLIGGFRYFEVDEIYDIIDPASTPTTKIGLFSWYENAMAGGQLGVEGILVSNGYGRIFGSCKGAVLANNTSGFATATDPTTGATIFSTADDNFTSQLLDLQLGGSLGLTKSISIYSGYQGLVASDLAMVLEQSRNTSINGGPNPVFRSDTQWHGFRLVASFVW